MCFDLDSAPPIPPLSGAAVSHDDLVLEAPDGNRFAAFLATPEEPARAGVVILPDVRGLYRFYEELALRFAERGYAAVAFDYFGRTAGARSAATTSSTCRTCSRRRRTGCRRTSARASSTFAPRGAPPSSRSGSASEDATRGSPPQPITVSPERSVSTGGLARGTTGHRADSARRESGADTRSPGRRRPRNPGRGLASVRRGARPAGVQHDVVIYDGAPHSFFDRKHEEFAEASEDAWNRVLAFLERTPRRRRRRF